MHREPQPVKLYTIAPMYRYAAPQRGRYREHYQLSLESIGSADPAVDAEVLQFYDALLRNLGVDALRAAAQLDRRPQLPARVRRASSNEWLDAHADVLDDDAQQKRATSPLRVFDVKNERVRAALAGRAEDRRVALRRVRASTSRRCARYLDAYGVAVHARPDARARARLLHAHDVRVRRARTRARRPRRSAAAAATTISSRRSAARRRRASASAPASSGCILSLELEGITAEAPRLDLFLVVEARGAARRACCATMAELRATGFSCDTDYAGRSLKGQLTQAQKRAHGGRDPRSDGWTLRAPRRAGPDAARRWRSCCEQLARHDLRRARARPTSASASRSPAGSTRAATTAGSSSSTCATSRGKVQLVVNPERARRGGGVAHEIRNEFVLQAEGEVVRARAGSRQPEPPDRRDRGAGRHADDRLALEPLPFQIGEENVDEVLRLRYRWLDMRSERMQRNLRLRPHRDRRRSAATMDELGLRRRLDADR